MTSTPLSNHVSSIFAIAVGLFANPSRYTREIHDDIIERIENMMRSFEDVHILEEIRSHVEHEPACCDRLARLGVAWAIGAWSRKQSYIPVRITGFAMAINHLAGLEAKLIRDGDWGTSEIWVRFNDLTLTFPDLDLYGGNKYKAVRIHRLGTDPEDWDRMCGALDLVLSNDVKVLEAAAENAAA